MGLICNTILRCRIKAKSFFYEERGVAAIIATVLILVIVVALAAIFWDTISDWFAALWERIFNTAPDPTNTGSKYQN